MMAPARIDPGIHALADELRRSTTESESTMLHAVVMAGGSGTRFWPMSRTALPKQMLALVTERPLLEETVLRLDGVIPRERVMVVTNAAYAAAARQLLHGVPAKNVVPEPCGRDTAACIGLAATLALDADPDAVLAVLAADHVVSPVAEFRATLARAAEVIGARPRSLVTFGITPTRPATGYGYLERGGELGRAGAASYFKVAAFREKPDAATAERFVAAGNFLWNAGIFVFRADAILERITRFLPDLARELPAVAREYREHGAISRESYAKLQKISIDFGVMEKDDDVVVLEASFSWDDVGSFAALERVLPHDDAGNCGFGPRAAIDAKDNVVVAGDGHLIALIGVNDLVVVRTADATLVCRKADAERVKEMVAALEKRGESRLL
jgi:mannose-1-phosphate guanylyltransferase